MSDIDIDAIRERQKLRPPAFAAYDDVATLLAEVDRLNGVVAERDAQIDNEIDTITELGMRCEYITVLGDAMSAAIGNTEMGADWGRYVNATRKAWDERALS